MKQVKKFLLVFSILVVVDVDAGVVDPPVGCTLFPYVRTPLCSGRGYCVFDIENGTSLTITEPNVPNSRCVCDPGWTGRNDFTSMDTHDCGQNILFIRILWFGILLGSLYGVSITSYKLYQSFLVVQTALSNEEEEGKGSRTTIAYSGEKKDVGKRGRGEEARTSNPPKSTEPQGPSTAPSKWLECFRWPVVSTAFMGQASALCLMSCSIIRLIDPLAAIGVAPLTTIFYLIGDLLFCIAEPGLIFAWLKVRSAVVRFTAKDDDAVSRATLRLKKTMYLSLLLALGRTLAAFLILYYPQHANFLTVIYFQTLSLTTCVSVMASIQAGRPLENMLLEGMEHLPSIVKKEREAALNTIRGIMKNQKQQIATSAILAAVIAWFPFLRSHLTYALFPLIFTSSTMASRLSGMAPPKIQSSTNPRCPSLKITGDTMMKTKNEDETPPPGLVDLEEGLSDSSSRQPRAHKVSRSLADQESFYTSPTITPGHHYHPSHSGSSLVEALDTSTIHMHISTNTSHHHHLYPHHQQQPSWSPQQQHRQQPQQQDQGQGQGQDPENPQSLSSSLTSSNIIGNRTILAFLQEERRQEQMHSRSS